MKIYKYDLKRDYGKQIIVMPAISIPFSFGFDPQGQLCIWAHVMVGEPNWGDSGGPHNPQMEHVFFVGVTGQDGPELPLDVLRRPLVNLGTVNDGGFMIHCFYVGRGQQK